MMKKVLHFSTLFLFTLTFINQITAQVIIPCDSIFYDTGSADSEYNNGESETWMICPDDSLSLVSITFTHVDIEVAGNYGVDSTGCYDILHVYEGEDNTGKHLGSYCGEESGNGYGSYVDGNTLSVGMNFTSTSIGKCFYIEFESDLSTTRSGWAADITCCSPSLTGGFTDGFDLPIANNDGMYLNKTIDNSCQRVGDIQLITDYVDNEDALCLPLTLPNKSFLAFTSDFDGGFTELILSELDSVGQMEMIVLGPVTLQDSIYIGGVINSCYSGTISGSMFFNVGEEQTYILGVATEYKGAVSLTTSEYTEGLLPAVLPVTVSDYKISNTKNRITLDWETTAEINNAGFEIYRSYDKHSFTQIGWVDAAEDGSKGASYKFLDKPELDVSTVYYYVKQIDMDGKGNSLGILQTSFIRDDDVSLVSFPNPSFSSNFTIKLEGAAVDKGILDIYNSVGQKVHSIEMANNVVVDLPDMEKGMYTLIYYSGDVHKISRHIIR